MPPGEDLAIIGFEPLDEPLDVGFLERGIDFGINLPFPLGLRPGRSRRNLSLPPAGRRDHEQEPRNG